MDQNAYVNAYIDLVVGMLHDQLNQILQLKTQTKITETLLAQKDSTISEKDAAIADLSSRISAAQANDTELNNLRERLRVAEDSYHAVSNKLSHMETLQQQFNDMKRQVIDKDKELTDTKTQLANLSAEIQDLKKVIKEKDAELKEAKSVIDAISKAKEPEDTEVLKKKINRKKESVSTLELPTPIKEMNDF